MMKRTAIVAVLCAVLVGVSVNGVAADRVVLAEMFGGTWCGYCPDSSGALQILRGEFRDDQFLAIYNHVGGADPWRTSESESRASWYSVGGVPHVEFDGVTDVVGSYGSPEATADAFRPIVNSRLGVSAPLTIEAVGIIGSSAGWVDATIKATESISHTDLRAQFVLIENGMSYGGKDYDFTARDYLPVESLSLSSPGDSVVVNRNFTIDPTWDHTNMELVVFVERTTVKQIVNAGLMTNPYQFDFETEVYAAEVPLMGGSVFTTVLRNTGTVTDTITVNIENVEIPDGVSSFDWFATYCDEEGLCYFGEHDFVLAPGEFETLDVHMDDYNGSVPGMAVTRLFGTSAGDTTALEEEYYATFVGMPSILVVEDDGDDTYGTYMKSALDSVGYAGHLWDAHTLGRPGADRLASYWAVLWTTGNGDATDITADDESDLMSFLDDGGNLFLASMNYLSSRAATNTFITDYLNVSSWTDDAGGFVMTGVSGDIISDGMSLGLLGGDFAPGATDKFVISSPADSIFYASNGVRGLKVDDGYKAVFTSFPFELVKTTTADPDNQMTLIDRILTWFQMTGVDDVIPGVQRLSLGQNYPNPFNPVTTIEFSVPASAERVELEVYNVAGRLVRTLVDGELEAGPHRVIWDGTDGNGKSCSSGIYFTRLTAGRETKTGKMTLLK
ncbi:MAG: T9SS type A sorting domain-containing protein [Candidatus Eisenbacteria bacterium]|nr:T9SS type A sorting domain-containing protein [Candidatus Eisenbacteria bacterium]